MGVVSTQRVQQPVWNGTLSVAHLELAQPINKLEDPQIKIPRPRPIAFTIETTAMLPVKDIREKERKKKVAAWIVNLSCVFFPLLTIDRLHSLNVYKKISSW